MVVYEDVAPEPKSRLIEIIVADKVTLASSVLNQGQY